MGNILGLRNSKPPLFKWLNNLDWYAVGAAVQWLEVRVTVKRHPLVVRRVSSLRLVPPVGGFTGLTLVQGVDSQAGVRHHHVALGAVEVPYLQCSH